MFKVGDKVNWLGMKGKVVEVNERDLLPVTVKFEQDSKLEDFTLDGRWYPSQEPSLKLIERPKSSIAHIHLQLGQSVSTIALVDKINELITAVNKLGEKYENT